MDLVLEESTKSRRHKNELAEEGGKNAFAGLTGGQQVQNQLKGLIASGYAGKKKDKDKSDRSVVEKVIDPKTERLFAKWIKNGVIRTINGCISSGKEANVYHAVAGDGKDLALKIYKVDTMVFRDREEYISGEHRFKRGHVRSNAYKLIKVWAEKEFRNLRRIKESGIVCPEAYLVKENLILMEFLVMVQIYHPPKVMMRRLWTECKMVHGDLSAYNMLWHEGNIALIDVSQSVEESHPQAIEFLKRDLRNVSRHFRKLGVRVANLDSVFDLIREKGDHNLRQDTLTRLKSLQSHTPQCAEEDWELIEDRFISKEVLRGLHEIAPEEVEAEMERMRKGGQGKYTEFLGGQKGKEESEDSEEGSEEGSEEEQDGKQGEEPVLEGKRVSNCVEVWGLIYEGVQEEEDSEQDGSGEEEDEEEEDSESDGSSSSEVYPEAPRKVPDLEELEKAVQLALLMGGVEDVKGVESVTMKKREKVQDDPTSSKNKRRADDFSGLSKEERKKLVKEEKREQRAHKIPKKEKKKLTKKAKH